MCKEIVPVYVNACASILSSDESELVFADVFGQGRRKIAFRKIEESFVHRHIQNSKLQSKLDRFSHFAIIVVQKILGIFPDIDHERTGIFIGNMLGGWNFGQRELSNLHEQGFSRFSPYQATAWFPAAPQGEISIFFGLKGFSKTLSGGILSGLEAFTVAIDAIRAGNIDSAIVGATESLDTNFGLNGIIDMPEIAKKVLGEGCILCFLSNVPRVQHPTKIALSQIRADITVPYFFESERISKDLSTHDIFYTSLQPLIDLDSEINQLPFRSSTSLKIYDSRRCFSIDLTK